MTNYPVGGPREPVYALMRKLGFTESPMSDKWWLQTKNDVDIEVRIYGAGSMAQVLKGGTIAFDCALDDLESRLAE